MNFSRIILVAASVGASFLLGGCVHTLGPVSDQEAIRFVAESTLLRDDATKGEAPKEGTTFSNGEGFYVFGSKTISGTPELSFSGSYVRLTGGVWDYTPHHFWDKNASRYDFIGISGPANTDGISFSPASDPLTATVTYDVRDGNQCDLMAACKSVTIQENPVSLSFKHMLSAVKVTVYNDSPTQKICLFEYYFMNLVVLAHASVAQGANDSPVVDWPDWSMTKDLINHLLLWKPDPDNDNGVALTSNQFAPADNWNMMIPQDLNPVTSPPYLIVKYQKMSGDDLVDSVVETPIALRSILNMEGDAITEWEKGIKYEYEIHIRYGGGIRVHVITTKWDEISAGTPGLIIS